MGSEKKEQLRAQMEHGIDGAAYNMGIPTMICLCGYVTSRGNSSWEDAGADFDRHLEEHGAS